MIRLEDVRKTYRTAEIETIALDDINISIDRGEFVSIMGPSGCGKSTLLNLIGLLDTPTRGSVILERETTGGRGDKWLSEFRNRNIGFVFQSFHLIPSLNVMDNVALPLGYRKGEDAREGRKRVREVLEYLGLGNRLRHFPAQLSGGQCQRVAIARAIVGNPDIILADEPTGNLDSRMGTEVMDFLMRLNREEGKTIVMVTHNEEQARLTDRILRLFDGRQVQ
ncbi:MAG: ABC transporter ATP-binding protein [Muribaculaceae bacterium]|nr:ABC transporter ATP-binding protein [Muribaculaceae bacterium]